MSNEQIDTLLSDLRGTLSALEKADASVKISLGSHLSRVRAYLNSQFSEAQRKYLEEDLAQQPPIDLALGPSGAEGVDGDTGGEYGDLLSGEFLDVDMPPVQRHEQLSADVERIRECLEEVEADEQTRAAFRRIVAHIRRLVEGAPPEISAEELAAVPLYPGQGTDSMAWYKQHWAPLVQAGRAWQHHFEQHDRRLFNAVRARLHRQGKPLWQLVPPKPGYADEARRRERRRAE